MVDHKPNFAPVKRHFGTVVVPEHNVSLRSSSGQDGPQEHYSHCICGWEGVKIDTYPKWEDKAAMFIKPLQPLVRLYGVEIMNDGGAYGDRDDALIQVLHHLSYDPAADLDAAEGDYQATMHGLHYSAPADELRASAQALTHAAEEIVNARHRNEVWRTRSAPEALSIDPKIVRLVDIIVKNTYSTRDQLTEDDLTFMQEELEKING